MAPTITVIRTAEALHNINATSNFLTRDQLEKLNFGYDLPDPYLTSAGLMQCADASVRLGEELAKEPDPVLNFVVTAPSKRAIQTALLCVAPSIERLGSITIHRALRPPNPTHGCNQIASRDDLDKEFGNLINSHFVDEEEPGVAGPDAMLPENVEERARGFRAWLQDICKRASAELPDSSIYVVADVEFIVYLTGDFVSGYVSNIRGFSFFPFQPVSGVYLPRYVPK